MPAHLGGDIRGQTGPPVDHREDHPRDDEPRVQPGAHEVDGPKQLSEPFECVVLALHRDKDAVGGRESVDGQRPERRRAVHESEGVALTRRAEGVREERLAVLTPGELDGSGGQLRRGRHELEVLEASLANDVLEWSTVQEVEGRGIAGLLTQAGWAPGPDGIMQKGGQRLSLSWVAARGRYPKDGEITEAVQAMFKDVGVEAKVQILEWAAVFKQVRDATLNHHLFTLGWVTSNADADYSLYALFHSKNAPPTGWNTSRYVNPKVDALIEQARRSLNQTEREKLYGDVQDILAKEMVWIPVYTTKEIIAARASVKGFTIHPVEYNLTLSKTWLDK